MDRDVKDRPRERALLVGLALGSKERWREADRLEELAQLATTAGAQVLEKVLQVREKPDPAYYIGKGKARELRQIADQFGVDLFIFDAELSPSQVRNLEKVLGRKVIDRTELIMDIFAQHAVTAEAKIQVEMAQLSYRLPRLTGKGLALSRLGGGIGTRGPGEKKLEVDRRRILDRLALLRKQLKNIERTKALQRKRRRDLFKVSLVGYTNAGKSSIMNALTHAGVLVEDKLFATLDATTRVLPLEKCPVKVVLSDTVGFIEDLPVDLVASFHATLSVVQEADLLLHVIDIGHPNFEARMEVVDRTLEEIGCRDKPIIRVFNKIDLLLDRSVIERLKARYNNAVFVSARTGEGLETLKEAIRQAAQRRVLRFRAVFRRDDLEGLRALHALAQITSEEPEDEKVTVEGFIAREHLGLLRRAIEASTR